MRGQAWKHLVSSVSCSLAISFADLGEPLERKHRHGLVIGFDFNKKTLSVFNRFCKVSHRRAIAERKYGYKPEIAFFFNVSGFFLVSFKFKKGDLVIVDDEGRPIVFEIVSTLPTNKGLKSGIDLCYDGKELASGVRRTIYEDEILRLATPVDNSAQLFKKEK
jgi:hypothetical protein